MILDTLVNVLRAYSFGETGNGTVLGSDLSDSPGSGERAAMVEIHALAPVPPVPLPGLGAAGLLLLVAGVGTVAAAALRRSYPIGDAGSTRSE